MAQILNQSTRKENVNLHAGILNLLQKTDTVSDSGISSQQQNVKEKENVTGNREAKNAMWKEDLKAKEEMKRKLSEENLIKAKKDGERDSMGRLKYKKKGPIWDKFDLLPKDPKFVYNRVSCKRCNKKLTGSVPIMKVHLMSCCLAQYKKNDLSISKDMESSQTEESCDDETISSPIVKLARQYCDNMFNEIATVEADQNHFRLMSDDEINATETRFKKDSPEKSSSADVKQGPVISQKPVLKSSYMRLFELNAQVPRKLTLSSSSTKNKTREDGVIEQPTLDYITKVSSWLIHEDQNMSTPPSPSPPPSIFPPDPSADSHTQTSSCVNKVPLRHSRRQRIKPVEYWNNETAIYDDDGTLRAVENTTACFDLSRYAVKTKNLTSVKELDRENPHSLKTVKDFRSPLKNKSNVKSKKVSTITRTKNKKVVESISEIRSQVKINIKGKEKSSNKRKFDKEGIENENTDSTKVTEIYNEMNKNSKKKKSKLESIPFPCTKADIGVRRGGRNRIKPVAFWDNEFVQYDEAGNLLGVEHVGLSAQEIEEDRNRTRRKSSDEKTSIIYTEVSSSVLSSSNFENQKKNKEKKKKKINTTDLATKIIRRSRGKRKKITHMGLTEYPFNQLNKESLFTLGRILEITDKNGTIRKLSPIKEAKKLINQAEYLSKENSIRRQDISNINGETVVSVIDKELQSDVPEKASKALEAQSSPPTDVRRSRRSRIAPVEYWNSQYVQYNIDGTLEGVEDWTSNFIKKTPLKESSSDNVKELKNLDVHEESHKLFSPSLNVLEEAATNDVSSSLSRRRLFDPIAPSATKSRATNADEEPAIATLSVKIHSIRKQNRDQNSKRVLNTIADGISDLPLTPIAEETSKILDYTKSSAPLSAKSSKSSKGTDKVLNKSPVMTWLEKETFVKLVNEKNCNGHVRRPNDNRENNCNSGVSCVEVGESIGFDDHHITDFEAAIENSAGNTEELSLNKTPKQIQLSRDHPGKRLSLSTMPTLTPYQAMQKEMEEFQLNTSMKSPQTDTCDNIKTTISFVPQKVNHLKFNAPWATLSAKKIVSDFEVKSKNVSKERRSYSNNSSEKLTENSLDQNLCNDSLQVEKENHMHSHSKTMNKSAHTVRLEENSPLLQNMQEVSKEQNQRSEQIRSKKDASASKYAKEFLPFSSDVLVNPSAKSSAQQNADECTPSSIDPNVPMAADASVTESLEAYVKNMADCLDRTLQSKTTLTQDKPEYSGGESLDTTTGHEEKDNHEFYPIIDPNTGLPVCHMAHSVVNKESGIYTAFISIQEGRGLKTWEVSEDSVVFVMDGIGTLRRKLGKKCTDTPLEPNEVVNLAKGEMVSLSYNVRKSKVPLVVMLIVGGTSIEWPELAEVLEEEG